MKRSFFISDVRQLFQKWLLKKEKSWLEYYGSFSVIVCFIGDKEGLNAVCDDKDYNEIVRLLKPDFLKSVR